MSFMLSLVYLQPQENTKVSVTYHNPREERKVGSAAVRISENDSKPWGNLKEAGPFLTLLVKHVYLASTKTGFDHWILHFKLVNFISIKI